MATRKIKRTYEQPRMQVVELKRRYPLLAGSNQLNMTNTSNWQEGDDPQNNDEIEIFF